jgi:hypothetical protein
LGCRPRDQWRHESTKPQSLDKALAFARDTPASLGTLFALRWQSGNYWVVSRNWSDFGSTARGTNLGEKVNVCLVVLTPLARKVVLVIDSFNWANWLASTAVNTLIGVDVKHAVTLIDTVDGTLINTSFVFHVHTGQGDYVRHIGSLNELEFKSD